MKELRQWLCSAKQIFGVIHIKGWSRFADSRAGLEGMAWGHCLGALLAQRCDISVSPLQAVNFLRIKKFI